MSGGYSGAIVMDANGVNRKHFPLRLCEVLEREYTVLHGSLRQPPSWLLEGDDIRAQELVARLQNAAETASDGPLRAIYQRLQSLGLILPSSGFANSIDERSLVDVLNRALLSDECIYDPTLLDTDSEVRRLASARSTHARGVEQTEPSAGTETSGASAALPVDDQVQLNRLLLEAAFPAEVVVRVDTVRLTRLFGDVHTLAQSGGIRSALCLSGGGIRSAAFALGAMQGLARHDVLDKFDYLSTVSGGGYAGSWLSTWTHRSPKGLTGVCEALGGAMVQQGSKWDAKIEPVPEPIRFLRSYSRFLNPKAGLFSLDTWTWVGIYLRNLSLNWLVIIPLLLLVLMAPRLYASLARVFEQSYEPVSAGLFWLATLAAVSAVVCAVVNRPSVSDPARRADQAPAARLDAPRAIDRVLAKFRQQHWILALGVIPLLLFSTFLSLVIWGLPVGKTPLPLAKSFALLVNSPLAQLPAVLPFILLDNILLWGELIVILGWLVSIALLPRSAWANRARELLAMLLAGALTWMLVAQFGQFIALLGAERHVGYALLSSPVFPANVYAILAVPALVLGILAGMTLFIGVVSKYKWIEDEDREWWARFGAWVLIATLGWSVLSAITVLGPLLLFEWPKLVAALGGVSGLVAVMLGKSALSPAKKMPDVSQPRRVLAATGINSLALLAAIFLATFLAALALLSSAGLALLPMHLRSICGSGPTLHIDSVMNVLRDSRLHLEIFCQTPPADIVYALIALAAFVLAASLTINLNKFSLHASYRIRIARTFLGASRGADRRPNPFTGFDPLDNVQMHELQPGLLREADVLDLKGLVGALHEGVMGGDRKSPAAVLAEKMCSPAHDRYGVLKARLKNYRPGDPLLISLQRDVVATLNRLLETERLDLLPPFQTLLGGEDAKLRAALASYVEHDSRIFANRLLLERAFMPRIKAYQFPPPPPHRLLHVINLTLNLVHGRKLAWQERKAAPFVVTPMHCGSYYLGYRPSRDYGGKDGISIATAAAISGAAVSPNMGYSSSPITALLLTLFNVRLGWWLGNPGVAGNDTYLLAEPKISLRPILSEALGLTDDQSPYVYLSDGGHFENLGLFEMVLRRCHLIVVVDAAADPDYRFSDLGNAVRKVRLDFGIPIEFAVMPIHKQKSTDDGSGRYCAIGRICYASVDGPSAPDGVLLYFKPVLRGGEPADVLQYAAENSDFPQEPTLDQFFGEAQFESYRRLAEFSVDAACGGVNALGEAWAAELVTRVQEHTGGSEDQAWLRKWIESHDEKGLASSVEARTD